MIVTGTLGHSLLVVSDDGRAKWCGVGGVIPPQRSRRISDALVYYGSLGP